MTSGPLPVSPTTNSTLLWDGENRLTEVKNSTGTTIEKNIFDSGSRKIATTANGITTLYLYDGWNCIAEYTRSVGVSPTLQKTRLWGADLSGSMQGAGGVGGMLSESSPITSNPITFNSSYPTYDGNGNVSEYLDSTGQVTAHYEYDPFGNTVVNTDTANQFAYRFSTKPIGIATGLYYYGYRYYDPLTGRWPSRDPIGEMGGVNLYGFVGNDGVDYLDVLGNVPCKRGEVHEPVCLANADKKLDTDRLNNQNTYDNKISNADIRNSFRLKTDAAAAAMGYGYCAYLVFTGPPYVACLAGVSVSWASAVAGSYYIREGDYKVAKNTLQTNNMNARNNWVTAREACPCICPPQKLP
jgi:RHS repeat-associated protein